MPILRKFMSVVAGIFAGGLVVAAVEAAGHAVLNGEWLFAAAAAGYGLAAAAGSFVAGRLGDRLCSVIVTGVLALLAAINLFAFPHPPWFTPIAVVLLVLGWRIGSRMAGPGRSAAAGGR